MAVPNLTANSPVVGSIAWSAFTIQYGGVGYGVGASSTALKYVYWVYNSGSPILSASNTLPTLGADDLLLFMNKAGIPINVPASSVIDGSIIVDGTIVGSALIAGTVHGDRVQAGTLAADRIAADSITANQIAVGAIGALELAAGSVTASKMVITNLSNMIEDGSFEKGGTTWAAGTTGAIATVAGLPHGGTKVLRQTSAAAVLDSIPNQAYEVTAGEIYYLEALVRKTTTGTVGNIQLAATTSNDGAGLNYPTAQQVTMASLVQNTWTKLSGMITIPAASNRLQVRLSMRNDVPAAEVVEWDNVILRKASSGELIVDGAITTNKMTANAINGDRITAGTLAAAKVVANSLTSAQIAARGIAADRLVLGDTTDYINNADFLDLAGWSATPPAGWAVVADANFKSGSGLKTVSTQGNYLSYYQIGTTPAAPGEQYHISAKVRNISPAALAPTLRIIFQNAAGSALAGGNNGTSTTDTAGAYVARTSTSAVAPAGTVKMAVFVEHYGGGVAGQAGEGRIGDLSVRRLNGGELIVDGAITTNKILTGAVTADKVAANSITSNKIAVSDFTNLWANQRFEYATPTIGTTSVDVPPTGGNARLLNMRDHSGSERFPISEGGQFRIEYVGKRIQGTLGLNAGVIMRDSTGAQTATPWIFPAGTLMADLGNGWGRYFTEVTIPVRTPAAAYADLFFQIGNPNGGPYDTHWAISDVVVRRKAAGELIVDGAITASKLTIGALGQTLVGNGGFEDEMTGWVVGSTATRQTASARSGSMGVRLASSGSVALRSPSFPIGEGERLSITGWAKQVTATTRLYLRVEWRNAAGAAISVNDTVGERSTTTSWEQYGGLTNPAPAGTVSAVFQAYNLGGVVDLDDIDVRKAIISAHISDGAIVADKIQTNAVTAVKIATDAVTAGKIDADAITAREIQADTITAAEIAVGTITGDEIAANSIDVNHLKAGTLEAGYTLTGQLDVTGAIRVGDSTWTPEQGLVFPGALVLPPVAGGNASIDAHVTARSLTVNKDLNILGMSNKISGQLTLSNGVTNPNVAPTPYSFLPSITTLGMSFGSIYYGVAPHPSDTNLIVTAEAFYGAKIRAFRKDTGEGIYIGDPAGTWAGTGPIGFNPVGGITTLGGFYYLLGQDSGRNYRWFIYKIDSSQNKVAEVEYVKDPASGRIAIGNDGTNILTAATDGGGAVYVNYYNAGTLALGMTDHYPNFANIGNQDIVSVAKGSFDFGSNRVVIGVANEGAFVVTPAPNPTRDDAYKIPSPGGVMLRGHVWLDGRFWSFDKDGRWYKHGKNVATQTLSSSYTWYDGAASGGTHESMESPAAPFTLAARQWYGVTTPTPPDSGSNAVNVDKANQVGFYVGINGGTRRRQAYSAFMPDGVTAITNYQTDQVTSTNPGAPGANGFIGSVSSPGTLVSADGTSMKIDGAGAAEFASLRVAGRQIRENPVIARYHSGAIGASSDSYNDNIWRSIYSWQPGVPAGSRMVQAVGIYHGRATVNAAGQAKLTMQTNTQAEHDLAYIGFHNLGDPTTNLGATLMGTGHLNSTDTWTLFRIYLFSDSGGGGVLMRYGNFNVVHIG